MTVLVAVAAALVVALVLARRDEEPPPKPRTPGPRTTSTATPAPPAPSGPRLGLAVGMGAMFVDPTFGPPERARVLDLAHADGVTEARVDALWEKTELAPPPAGKPPVYDWRYADTVAGELAQHGIRWWVVLDYAANWASENPRVLHSPPREPGRFASWAAAVARRYGPGGDFWKANPQLDPQPVRTYEVWNEPNVKIFWPPQADPEAYAALFDVAQAALRRVQPGARVVTAGLAPFQDYVARMVKARPSIARTASAIGLHPYAPTPAGVLAKVRTARRQLRAAGLGKVPLALTELGWVLAPGDDPLFVREPTRARYVTETARDLAASGCGVEDLALYSWISSEGTTPDRNRWYGIARRPGRPTASTRAWARLESDPPPLRAGRCR